MTVLHGSIVNNIEDDLLDRSYKISKKVLESKPGSHLKPFIVFKTFEEETGIAALTIDLNRDLEEQNDEVIKKLKELCRQKRICDIYIAIEMQRTMDENNMPVLNPEYYIFITHETHLTSNMFAAEIITNEDRISNVGPLFKLDDGIKKAGPFFNILCPAVFHSA